MTRRALRAIIPLKFAAKSAKFPASSFQLSDRSIDRSRLSRFAAARLGAMSPRYLLRSVFHFLFPVFVRSLSRDAPTRNAEVVSLSLSLSLSLHAAHLFLTRELLRDVLANATRNVIRITFTGFDQYFKSIFEDQIDQTQIIPRKVS